MDERTHSHGGRDRYPNGSEPSTLTCNALPAVVAEMRRVDKGGGSDPSSPQQAERGAPCPRRLVRTPVTVHLLPSEKVANFCCGMASPIRGRMHPKNHFPLRRGEGGSQPALSSAGARREPRVLLVVGVRGRFLPFFASLPIVLPTYPRQRNPHASKTAYPPLCPPSMHSRRFVILIGEARGPISYR